MAAGQVGRRGAAVRPAFAREISAFEQELAPIPFQVKMEFIVMVTAPSRRIAKVSFMRR